MHPGEHGHEAPTHDYAGPMSTPQRFRDEDVVGADGLLLRALTVDDVPRIAQACADPLTQRWLPIPRPYGLDDARLFVTRTAPQMHSSGRGIARAIDVDGRFAGVIDLRGPRWRAGSVEIGYWLHPDARGRGLAGRAAYLLATWAMANNGFHRVEARVATGNEASLRTLRGVGFVDEGVLRDAGYTHDGRVDLAVLSLVRGDVDWPRGEPIHP